MAVFTSWADLATAIRNDIASGGWMDKSYTVDGDSRTFRSLKEVTEFLGYVEQRAASESRNYCGRTVAGEGGRG